MSGGTPRTKVTVPPPKSPKLDELRTRHTSRRLAVCRRQDCPERLERMLQRLVSISAENFPWIERSSTLRCVILTPKAWRLLYDCRFENIADRLQQYYDASSRVHRLEPISGAVLVPVLICYNSKPRWA